MLNEDTHSVIRANGVSHTACKCEFRGNLRVYIFFIMYGKRYHSTHSLCFEHAHRKEFAPKRAIFLLELQLGLRLASSAAAIQASNEEALKRRV